MKLPALIPMALASGLLFPSIAGAQVQRFTVTAETANIRAEPTIGSPVVRQVARGTVIEVTDSQGGWLRVSLLNADGSRVMGFVSAAVGTLDEPLRSTMPKDSGIIGTSSSQTAFPRPLGASPRTFSAGGMLGGFSFGVGGSLRYWTSDRVGVQVGLSRYSLGMSDPGPSGYSSSYEYGVSQFGPAVIFRLGGPQVDDDLFLRPYAGGGVNIYRTSSNITVSQGGEQIRDRVSETNFGFDGFGGVEVGFRDARRITVSGDLGYYSTSMPFLGLRLGGFAYSLSVHWYFR